MMSAWLGTCVKQAMDRLRSAYGRAGRRHFNPSDSRRAWINFLGPVMPVEQGTAQSTSEVSVAVKLLS